MNYDYEIVQLWLRRDHDVEQEEVIARIANHLNIDEWDVYDALRREGYVF